MRVQGFGDSGVWGPRAKGWPRFGAGPARRSGRLGRGGLLLRGAARPRQRGAGLGFGVGSVARALAGAAASHIRGWGMEGPHGSPRRRRHTHPTRPPTRPAHPHTTHTCARALVAGADAAGRAVLLGGRPAARPRGGVARAGLGLALPGRGAGDADAHVCGWQESVLVGLGVSSRDGQSRVGRGQSSPGADSCANAHVCGRGQGRARVWWCVREVGSKAKGTAAATPWGCGQDSPRRNPKPQTPNPEPQTPSPEVGGCGRVGGALTLPPRTRRGARARAAAPPTSRHSHAPPLPLHTPPSQAPMLQGAPSSAGGGARHCPVAGSHVLPSQSPGGGHWTPAHRSAFCFCWGGGVWRPGPYLRRCIGKGAGGQRSHRRAARPRGFAWLPRSPRRRAGRPACPHLPHRAAHAPLAATSSALESAAEPVRKGNRGAQPWPRNTPPSHLCTRRPGICHPRRACRRPRAAPRCMSRCRGRTCRGPPRTRVLGT